MSELGSFFLTYLLAPWLRCSLRTLASFTADAHSASYKMKCLLISLSDSKGNAIPVIGREGP
jgi:hypothetical protein